MTAGGPKVCAFCEPAHKAIVRELETGLERGNAKIAEQAKRILELEAIVKEPWRGVAPVEMEIFCPSCGRQHLDVGEFATRVHRKHLCENTPAGLGTGCGHLWVHREYATKGVLEVVRPEDS